MMQVGKRITYIGLEMDVYLNAFLTGWVRIE